MDGSDFKLEDWLEPDYPNNERYSHRKFLPSPMNNKNESPNIWNIMITNSGKDLSKITMPIHLNEPISFLQRISEYMEYSNLLFQASLECDPLVRLEILTAFIIASVSSTYRRSGKPFNPLLGETFEINKKEERGYIFVSEQVCHHPPISAFYVDATPYFTFWGTLQPKLKFWGKSLEIYPKGTLFLNFLEYNEVYQWQNVPSVINNLLIGKVSICHQGESTIRCLSTKTRAHIKWKSNGWFKTNGDTSQKNQVQAQLYNSNAEKVKIVYGSWHEALFSVSNEEWDQNNGHKPSAAPLTDSMVVGVVSKLGSLRLFHNSTFQISPPSSLEVTDPSIPDSTSRHFNYSPSLDRKSVVRSSSSCSASPTNSLEFDLHFPLQTCLWRASPRPAHSRLYYNFTFFTLTLNELPINFDLLPPTDCRRRPDVRLFEQGKLEEASKEKQRLEDKQRVTRKKIKTKKCSQEPQAMWFDLKYCEYTQTDEWVFNGNYFGRNWENCPDIF